VQFSVIDPISCDLSALSIALEQNHVPSWKKQFWRDVEEKEAGLSSAIGLYTFGLLHGKSRRPWYVGKTSAKGGYKCEIFTEHKLNHYHLLLKKRGQPFFVFMPLRTSSGSLSKNFSGGATTIQWVEKRLITYALDRNPELLNRKDTRFPKEVFLPGLIGVQPKGKRSAQAQLARGLFGGHG